MRPMMSEHTQEQKTARLKIYIVRSKAQEGVVLLIEAYNPKEAMERAEKLAAAATSALAEVEKAC
jgi:hypothetical protein